MTGTRRSSNFTPSARDTSGALINHAGSSLKKAQPDKRYTTALRLILLAFILFGSIGGSVNHAAAASSDMIVIVDGSRDRVPLLPSTVLSDDSASLSPEQAADLLAQPDAKRNTRVISRGYLSSVTWARVSLEIEPAATGLWYFTLELPNFDHLDVYRIGPAPGDAPEFLFSIGDRELPLTDIATRFHIAPMDLKQGRFDILVRGETASTMTLDINLRKLDAMLIEEGKFVSWQIFLLGIFSILFLGALVLFLYTRHFIYLIYCANLFAHSTTWLLINGVGPGLLWPDLAPHFHIGPEKPVALSICTTITFAAYFLSTARVPRPVRVLLWTGAVLSGLLTLVCIVAPASLEAWTHPIVSSLGLPVLAVLMITTVIALLRNEPTAWPLMLTWVVFLGVITMVVLRDWGYIPSNSITLAGGQVAMFFEIIIFAGMLVHRLGKLQAEKIQLQNEALTAARAQEEVLERRVADRTAELAVAVKRERAALVLQRQFVAMVSHEFRTPLAVIDGVAQNLAVEQPETLTKGQRIRDMVKGLLRMIETCLIAERIEDGALRISRAPIDLRLLLETAVENSQKTAPGHDFNLEFPEQLPHLSADMKLLEIAINNLLENAIKHTPAGTAVTVAIKAEDGTVDLLVLDNGPGITAQDSGRIFEKYYRGAKTSGTGLGLYLVRAIIEANDGSVFHENNSPRGSRFVIRLPIQPGLASEEENDEQ
ncbi:ATP-binding protein [Roseibium sp.]|uniref:sensor histidine kinase n=1 Tax=Roseibium sp. TaxID=1936156 RepID=UPI00329A3BFF